jgi:hypothetical protein
MVGPTRRARQLQRDAMSSSTDVAWLEQVVTGFGSLPPTGRLNAAVIVGASQLPAGGIIFAEPLSSCAVMNWGAMRDIQCNWLDCPGRIS